MIIFYFFPKRGCTHRRNIILSPLNKTINQFTKCKWQIIIHNLWHTKRTANGLTAPKTIVIHQQLFIVFIFG